MFYGRAFNPIVKHVGNRKPFKLQKKISPVQLLFFRFSCGGKALFFFLDFFFKVVIIISHVLYNTLSLDHGNPRGIYSSIWPGSLRNGMRDAFGEGRLSDGRTHGVWVLFSLDAVCLSGLLGKGALVSEFRVRDQSIEFILDFFGRVQL